MANLRVEGLEALMARLQQLDDRVTGRVTNEALRAGAEVLRQETSRRAPRSNLPKQHLADNIVVGRVRSIDGGQVKFIEVGPRKDFFYGLFLEYGTTKMRARPFMGPALAEKHSEVREAMRRVLKAGLGL